MKLTDLTSYNIKNFFQGTLNHAIAKHLPEYIQEQAEMRANLCKPCTDNGSCIICKCKTPHMYYATGKVCDGGKWGEMVGKEEWEKFKLEQNNKDNDSRSNSININGSGSDASNSVLLPSKEDTSEAEGDQLREIGAIIDTEVLYGILYRETDVDPD